MSDQELTLFVGNSIIENWQYILSGLVAFLLGVVTLTWFFSKTLYTKQIKILELELTQQKDRFSQFESIMQSKFDLLEFQANLVKLKLSPEINEKDDLQKTLVEAINENPKFSQLVKIGETEASAPKEYKDALSSIADKYIDISNVLKFLYNSF